MSYTTKNYTEQGGEITHIGGSLVFDEGGKLTGAGLMPNQAEQSGTSGSDAKASINALLKKLKNAGIMVGDAFTLTVTKDVSDSVAGHADRQSNTNDIMSVAEADGIITITLSKKVSELKNFDGGNGWGVHKWLGIGVSAGISPITDLEYNDTALTNEDVIEATSCGLSAGYFVRWVAADLVLAGDETQKSHGFFTLRADGYARTEYALKIIEPDA